MNGIFYYLSSLPVLKGLLLTHNDTDSPSETDISASKPNFSSRKLHKRFCVLQNEIILRQLCITEATKKKTQNNN